MPTDPTPPKLLTEDGTSAILTEDGASALLEEGAPPPIVYGKPKKFVPSYHRRRPVRSR